MFIIIEGADRTGKSTLAEKLVSYMPNAVLIHSGPPKTKEPYKEYAQTILSSRGNIIFDRFHLGEFVYSQLWRGGRTLTDRQIHTLDKRLAGEKTIVIHATAETKDIIDRCQRDGEELLAMSDVDRCKSLFEDVMRITRLPVVRYDSSKMKVEDMISIMREYW